MSDTKTTFKRNKRKWEKEEDEEKKKTQYVVHKLKYFVPEMTIVGDIDDDG